MKKSLKYGIGVIGSIVIIIVIVVIMGFNGYRITKVEPTSAEVQTNVKEDTEVEINEGDIVLTSGNYIIGKDVPVGLYDIVAVENGGLVSTSDGLGHGDQMILGRDNMNKNGNHVYNLEFKNVNLANGFTLTVDGGTIKLVRK